MRAPEKASAIVLGVVLQDRHYEDKSLEVFKGQHTIDFEIAQRCGLPILGLASGE
jgi:hypothetical protein